jgi:NADH-quinone oxidoreductase subunit N
MNLLFVDFLPFFPVFLLSLTLLLVLVALIIRRHFGTVAVMSSIGLWSAWFLSLSIEFQPDHWLSLAPFFEGVLWQKTLVATSALFGFDVMAQLGMNLVLLCASICASYAYVFLKTLDGQREEFYLLLLCATIGAVLLVSAHHFFAFFIALELMSIPIYALVAYQVKQQRALEAGIKYFVLSSVAAAFALMGMALIYSATGSLSLVPSEPVAFSLFMMLGLIFVLLCFCFKLSWAPLHAWTPDVYQGAAPPAVAFLATVGKVAVLVVFMRWLAYVFSLWPVSSAWISLILSIVAVLSIFLGNLLAFNQKHLKRLLAYSSVAHFGYLIVFFLNKDTQSLASTYSVVYLYLFAYLLATLLVLGVLNLLHVFAGVNQHLDDSVVYRGLFWRHPMLAIALIVALLSSAGIPLTFGFIGKFFLFVETGFSMLLPVLILGSVMGAFYYFRVMMALFDRCSVDATQPVSMGLIGWQYVLIGLLVVSLLVLGLYPQPFFTYLNSEFPYL